MGPSARRSTLSSKPSGQDGPERPFWREALAPYAVQTQNAESPATWRSSRVT